MLCCLGLMSQPKDGKATILRGHRSHCNSHMRNALLEIPKQAMARQLALFCDLANLFNTVALTV